MICQAFGNISKEHPGLLTSVTSEHLSVLSAFASYATKALPSDAAVEAWAKREYHLISADWWERQVSIAARKYQNCNYDDDVLDKHVEKVVADATEKTMLHGRAIPALQERRPTRPAWPTLAISAGDVNMQGERSTHHNQSSANEIAQGTHIDQHRNMTIGSDEHDSDEGIQTEEAIQSDDELYSAPPPKLVVRRQRDGGLFTSRSVSASSSSSTAAAHRRSESNPPPPTRVVSAPTRYTYAEVGTGALPFLVLNVCVMNNKVHTIPIEFGTTLEEAVVLAVSVAPKWIRESNAQFCFEGRRGGRWVGMWPESRWDRVMQEAESAELVVELRLVAVE